MNEHPPATPEAEDGVGSSPLGQVLTMVHADLTRYVAFPSPEAADALTLWIAATHCQTLWEHASRFVLKSPVRRCGKSRALEVTRELVHKPKPAGNISAAAVVRIITEDDPPTLLLDEADSTFTRKGSSDKAEDLRNIINLGHSRGWPYIRWDVKSRSEEHCPTFAMAILAGIGDFPDTIEDRAVVISMQRRSPDEKVDQLRQRDLASLKGLGETLGIAVRVSLTAEYEPPDVPVSDRAADVWEPLVAVADAAGEEWPERARAACILLETKEYAPTKERLLEDVQAVWGDEERVSSADLCSRLVSLEEAPWGSYYGRELTQRDLAGLLRPYGVHSKDLKSPDGAVRKGYVLAELEPIFERYRSATGPLPAATDEMAGSASLFDPLPEKTASDQEVSEAGSGYRPDSWYGPEEPPF
jgi:hypothetical protein